MRTDAAVHFFHGAPRVAEVLGITPAAVRAWGAVVPLDRAVMLEKYSYGNLRVDFFMYDQGGRVKKEFADGVAA